MCAQLKKLIITMGKQTDGLLELPVRQEMIKRANTIRQKITEEKITLVIGAGASIAAGLPTWDRLVSALINQMRQLGFIMPSCYKDGQIQLEEKLKESFGGIIPHAEFRASLSDVNVLEAAEYITSNLKPEQFDAQKSMLPGQYPRKGLAELYVKEAVSRAIQPETHYLELPGENALNKAYWRLAQLMLNGHIHKAITYNYDVVLEAAMETLIDKKIVVGWDKAQIHSYIDGQLAVEGQCNDAHIYHVHGRLPADGYEQRYPESANIILSETSYYDIEQRSYNWVHHQQICALMESSCLFVGFSAQDYNFRRILKNMDAVGKVPQHYLLLNIDTMVKSIYESDLETILKNPGDCANTEARIELNLLLALKESYWEQRGFLPIWTTIDDLPSLLEQMNNENGNVKPLSTYWD